MTEHSEEHVGEGGSGKSRLPMLIIIIVVLGIAGTMVSLLLVSDEDTPDVAAIEANNRGVGLMGMYEYEEALEIFQGLTEAYPDWLDARVNLAIATLNRQNEDEGDTENALAILSSVLEEDPGHLRAQYCSGLLRLYRQSPADALDHFRTVAEADPEDPFAAYYVAQCLKDSQAFEESISWFHTAIRLDPYLRSAYYGLMQSYQRMGRSRDAQEMLATFEKLDGNPRARLVKFIYTQMGPKSLATTVDLSPAAERTPPSGPVFTALSDPVAETPIGLGWSAGEHPASVTVNDINGDGLLDVFVSGGLNSGDGATRNAVLIRDDTGVLELVPDHTLAAVDGVNAALWGDYDNDGLTDVYLCRRGENQLWRQSAARHWENATDSTGTGGGGVNTVDGAMVDADHDGDLDLFLVNADGPNELLNNNLDGTFLALAADRGIAGRGDASRQVLFADLDNDRDLDIVVINDRPPHDVFRNDRLWAYEAAQGFDTLVKTPIVAAAAVDDDADGDIELFTVTPEDVLQRWESGAGRWQVVGSWTAGEGQAEGETRILVGDVTGDGDWNVMCYRRGAWIMPERTDAPGSEMLFYDQEPSLLGATLASFSGSEGPTLVTITADHAPRVRRPGPGRSNFTLLSFTGMEDRGKSMRSNASGIGTQFAARAESRWTIGSTLRPGSEPGQSLQPIPVGLGGAKQLDFVYIEWPDGVFQSETELAAARLNAISETQRQLSSCPVVFAWDGNRFEFVTDVLGVGGMGFAVGIGEYATPRPWENLLMPAGSLASKDGRYQIKFTEPMEEACYLDAVRLTAYDLPPGWSLSVDERFSINTPEPTGRVFTYRETARPANATNDRGEDVTEAISEVDGQAAPVGEVDRRFIGRLVEDHVLTMTFDRPLDGGPGAPIFLADGWIEYPYSQTMFSAAQAKADYRAPTIEARGEDGRWKVVREQFGYPAGMPRQMTIALGNLPKGTRTLRVTTNQEIYWDRIVVAFFERCRQMGRQRLELAEAVVRRSGFAHRPELPQRRAYYDYDRRVPLWDTRHQSGYYTHFGPMRPLLETADGALAICGPGEEIHVEFTDGLKPLEAEWTRRFVLETEGWCKDMDLFTRDGETINPLPASGKSREARQRLHAEFNTRYESGR